MNELARLLLLVWNGQECRITDRKGNPWFAAKDICAILDIKQPTKAVKNFPPGEVARISFTTVTSNHSGGNRAVPHNLLIINESGVMRLILKSRKSNAWAFKERIIQLVKDYGFRGLAWAVLPRVWTYRGKELTWTEYVNKKHDAYFKRFPDATEEEFEATLPR